MKITDDLFNHIENCSSLEWIMKEIELHKDELTKDNIINVVKYYDKVVQDFKKHNK